jgi:uncharacterized protein
MGLRTPMSGTRIELWSGNYLDLKCPDVSTITHEDVIVGLSNTCRCAGQTRRFYSVAEHSLLVCDLVAQMRGGNDGRQRAALMHDAPEAFLHDLTAPLKKVLRPDTTKWEYDWITERVEWIIADLFGNYVAGDDDLVTLADQWAFVIEARSLLASQGQGYDVPERVLDLGGLPPGVAWHAGLDPLDARLAFKSKCQQLGMLRG